MQKFYICKHCGNIIKYVNNSGVKVVCCGEVMEELTPNTVDAAVEKHVPEVEQNNTNVMIKIGSVEHPMTEEHYIKWISVTTTKRVLDYELKPNMKPEVTFVLDDEEILEVFAYCNLHGLWKK